MTLDEAKEALSGMGIEPPDVVISGWLSLFDSAQDCLDEHYTDDVQALLFYYLIGLYGLTTGVRYVSSETAPSGASRSYRYGNVGELWRANHAALRLLDRFDCLGKLIPTNPTKAGAFLGVGKGGCYERHR